MSPRRTELDSLKRVFIEGFRARDITEPLASVDAACPPSEAAALMEHRDFDALGVLHDGFVAGFVEKQGLEGLSRLPIRDFERETVLSGSAVMTDVVEGLSVSTRIFVTFLGRVGGIITRSDLGKPPVRMWLFGMVTLIETRITDLISATCPNDSWSRYLSEGRLRKARELLAERQRRNQRPELIDCLQFSDKGQIIARCADARNRTKLTSRTEAIKVVKQLEALRNNLAHSQDIISSDWEAIVDLSANLDQVILGPPGLDQQPGK